MELSSSNKIEPDGADQVDESYEDMLQHGGRQLNASLAEDSDLIGELESIFERYTTGQITSQTWRDLRRALSFYLESNSVEYLLNLCVRSDDPDYVSQAKADISSKSWNALRRLLALFGESVRDANVVAPLGQDNWKTVNRWQYFDTTSRKLFVNYEITKVNGSRFALDENLDSFVQLVITMLDAIVAIDAEFSPGADVRDETRDRFFDAARRAIDALSAPDNDADIAGAPSDGDQQPRAEPDPHILTSVES